MKGKQVMSQARGAQFVLSHLPEEWPTLDEFPETDVSDLVRKFEENVVLED